MFLRYLSDVSELTSIYRLVVIRIMELDDPLIQSIIIYMYRHPGGVDLREMVCEDQYDEVMDCLIRNGMIREVRLWNAGVSPCFFRSSCPEL